MIASERVGRATRRRGNAPGNRLIARLYPTNAPLRGGKFGRCRGTIGTEAVQAQSGFLSHSLKGFPAIDTPWQITLFGGLCARQEDHVITRFATAKNAALLAYLALYP